MLKYNKCDQNSIKHEKYNNKRTSNISTYILMSESVKFEMNNAIHRLFEGSSFLYLTTIMRPTFLGEP